MVFDLELLTIVIQIVVLTSANNNSYECVDVNNPSTRSFDSLVDYQSNKVSFDAENLQFRGNYVRLTTKRLGVLQKNSFASYQSDYILKLFLNDTGIYQIDDGAFLFLSCLRILDLANNRIVEISRSTFDNLPHLKTLDLSRNQIMDVPEQTFKFTPRLRELDLSHNAIRNLHPQSFFYLTDLAVLDLGYNHLKTMLLESFQYVPTLQTLRLDGNYLEEVEPERWELKNLKFLNLSSNRLTNFDPGYKLTFSQLQELYLDHNFLTVFNTEAFAKNLPKVSVLHLDENRWICNDLKEILADLRGDLDFGGKSTLGQNVNNVSCSNVRKELPKTSDSTPGPADVLSGEKDLYERKIKISMGEMNDMYNSMENMHLSMIILFVIVVIVVIMDVIVRANVIERWYGRRRHHSQMLDNINVENFSLLGR